MHDNTTVAFEIKSPFRQKPDRLLTSGYRKTLITIWHVDPEKDGDENSCDWFGSHRKLNAREQKLSEAIFAIRNTLDNPPHYPDSPEHKWYQQLQDAHRQWCKVDRVWWQHPRWHVWHWRVQIALWQKLHRWIFERCSKCGGHFGWNEGVIGSGDGKKQWHFACHRAMHQVSASHHMLP